jgi:hypothetical protein
MKGEVGGPLSALCSGNGVSLVLTFDQLYMVISKA